MWRAIRWGNPPALDSSTAEQAKDLLPPEILKHYEKGEYVVMSDEDFRQANVEATQTIDIQGFVSDAKILRSIPLLDQAALDAVRQWEFTPTILNGQPVPVIMTVTVNFTVQ